MSTTGMSKGEKEKMSDKEFISSVELFLTEGLEVEDIGFVVSEIEADLREAIRRLKLAEENN